MSDRPCKECIWHSEDGCWLWDCDPVTRKEAKAILKECGKLKTCSGEIKVGDEVVDEDGDKVVVLKIRDWHDGEKTLDVLHRESGADFNLLMKYYKRTGKHYPEVDALWRALEANHG